MCNRNFNSWVLFVIDVFVYNVVNDYYISACEILLRYKSVKFNCNSLFEYINITILSTRGVCVCIFEKEKNEPNL